MDKWVNHVMWYNMIDKWVHLAWLKWYEWIMCNKMWWTSEWIMLCDTIWQTSESIWLDGSDMNELCVIQGDGQVSELCYVIPPEGRPGMSDVSPLSGISGLSFDSTLLSPLLFFCLALLPFLSYRFLPAGPFFSTFSRKFFNIFRKEIGFFVWLLFSG